MIEALIPASCHNTGQYQNNRVEADHGRLNFKFRPMRGLKTDATASAVIRGHVFVQNLRRGQGELGIATMAERSPRPGEIPAKAIRKPSSDAPPKAAVT